MTVCKSSSFFEPCKPSGSIVAPSRRTRSGVGKKGGVSGVRGRATRRRGVQGEVCRIGGWNVHGWQLNKGHVVPVVSRLALDVVVVSEPWVKSRARVSGYEWLGVKGAKAVVLVKAGIEAELLRGRSESRVTWVRMAGQGSGGGDLYVVGVYGYCEGKKVTKCRKWWKDLTKSIEEFSLGELVVCGDFNARIGKKAGNNGEEVVNVNGRRMLKMVERCGLMVCNTQECCEGKWTRVQAERRSVIDYVLVRRAEWSEVTRVCVEEGSGGGGVYHTDHKLVWLSRKRGGCLTEERGEGTKKWCLREGVDWEAYRQCLEEDGDTVKEELRTCLQRLSKREKGGSKSRQVEYAWDVVRKWIMGAAVKEVREKIVGGGRRTPREKKDWWSEGMEARYEKKKEAYRRYMVEVRQEEREEEKKAAWKEYRAAEADFRREMKRRKRNRRSDWVREAEKGGGELWRKYKKERGGISSPGSQSR
jgi:hypothetical protein